MKKIAKLLEKEYMESEVEREDILEFLSRFRIYIAIVEGLLVKWGKLPQQLRQQREVKQLTHEQT